MPYVTVTEGSMQQHREKVVPCDFQMYLVVCVVSYGPDNVAGHTQKGSKRLFATAEKNSASTKQAGASTPPPPPLKAMKKVSHTGMVLGFIIVRLHLE